MPNTLVEIDWNNPPDLDWEERLPTSLYGGEVVMDPIVMRPIYQVRAAAIFDPHTQLYRMPVRYNDSSVGVRTFEDPYTPVRVLISG